MKINYPDFIRQVSKKTGYSQLDIKAVLNAASDITIDNMQAGNSTVVLPGLVLEARDVPASVGRHPQNGQPINIPAHKIPKARFMPKFKDTIR